VISHLTKAWIATAAATGIVTAIGCGLIGRYRRIAAVNPASHDLAETG
jgi:hypothetical protein